MLLTTRQPLGRVSFQNFLALVLTLLYWISQRCDACCFGPRSNQLSFSICRNAMFSVFLLSCTKLRYHESEGFCYSTRILKSSVCSCVYVTDISLCTIFFLAVLFYRAAKSWHAEPLVSSWILYGLRAWIFVSYVGHVIWANMSGNTHT